MFERLSSKVEGFREMGVGAEVAGAEKTITLKTAEKSIANATEKNIAKDVLKTDAAVPRQLEARTAAVAEKDLASKETSAELKKGVASPETPPERRVAQSNEIAVRNPTDAGLAKELNVPTATVTTTRSSASKAWSAISKNPKATLIGLTVGALVVYMIVKGETNPAQAAGEMMGDVAAGAGKGVGAGLGNAATGLLDGLGLGPYITYIEWGCAACSCLACFLILAYIFKTFFK